MKKKYAFLLMGEDYHPERHRAVFETENMISVIQTVRSFTEAKETAMRLANEGTGAIELCGAFTSEMADEIVGITGEKVAVGFVVHNPRLDSLFASFFG